MTADGNIKYKYASIWCKNETKSLIRENPVVKIEEAFQFRKARGMKLWYPTKPFDDVPENKRKQMQLEYEIGSPKRTLTKHFLFWSSIERKNITHFKTPINEIKLDQWFKMESGETRNSQR